VEFWCFIYLSNTTITFVEIGNCCFLTLAKKVVNKKLIKLCLSRVYTKSCTLGLYIFFSVRILIL